MAGLLSAVLALLVKDKLLSDKHPDAAQGVTRPADPSHTALAAVRLCVTPSETPDSSLKRLGSSFGTLPLTGMQAPADAATVCTASGGPAHHPARGEPCP